MELSPARVEAIRGGFAERKLQLAALSGTYNMIDPDRQARETGAAGLKRVIALAPKLGAQVVTLCTGSRDRQSMWQRHEDNDRPEAWAASSPKLSRRWSLQKTMELCSVSNRRLATRSTPFTKLDGFWTQNPDLCI